MWERKITNFSRKNLVLYSNLFLRIGNLIRTRIGSRFHFQIQYEKLMLYTFKVHTKFSSVSQSFFEDQDPDEDQDQDFTLKLNTGTRFYILKTPTNFCFDPWALPKVIVSTDRQTDRQTKIWKFFFSIRTDFLWLEYFIFSHIPYVMRQ